MENGFDPDLCFGITVVKRIGAGLENLGNTCFLNSVLQCLTYTEPLAAYLQSGKHQVTCRKSGFCALCAIQKHVSRALQSSGRSLAPKDLVSNLRCISRTFRNSRQEDAHEYMVNLLESMHKCCLPNGVPSESETAYDRSLVHKIFGGRLRSQVKCMQCNHCSNKYDPFLDLSLEILRADNLYKAFANFTAKEQLDGGAKQYQCQQCKQKVKALKQLTIHKAPNVLTVHLKRFGSHMSGQKIDKKIQFGSTLDLKPFVTGPCDGDLKYTLYGVLVHAGWSTHSGHYYCFVRTSSGMWYSLDDNRVYQVSEKKVFEQKAYMLFYFKDRKNIPVKKTTEAAHQKEKIVMNGTPNGSSTPAEAQMKTNNGSVNGQKSLATVAQKETQMKTKFGSGLSNGHKSAATNSTINVPDAQKEAQMKTGSSNGSSNGQKSFSPVESKETQMNTTSSNGLPNGHNSSATVKCMQCNHCSNKYDPFLDLSLEILRADNLYKAFANFTAKEQLDGGAKQYQCQQCKQKVKALKQLTIHKAPNVLTVHLKRFGSHMSGQKIDKKIQFGSTLDLKPFVTGPCDGDLKYTLYGVLVHAGWSTHSGHYYCFVRTSSGMWYSLDDNRVYQVSEKKVFEQKAYMLFYFKDRKNIPVKKTTEAAHQKEKIVMNGTPNGSSTPAEAQMKTNNGSVNGQKSLATVAQKETQMKTKFGSGLSNGHKSAATNSTINVPDAQKEAQMKTGSSNGSSNGQKSFSPVESKETQMNTTSSNGLPNGHNSSATVGTLSKGLTNGALEQTEKKEGLVPKSISETILESSSNSKNGDISPQTATPEDAATKTEKNVKGIGGGKSFVGNSSSDGQKVVAAATTDMVELLKVNGSSVMKALRGKPHKKVKNHLRCKAISMKISSKILMGTKTKKKKNKRNKTVKNLGQENSVNEGPSSSAKIEAQEVVKNLVNEGPSSSVKTEAQEVVKNLVNEGLSSSVKTEAQEVKPSVENRFKERVNENGAVLATTVSSGVPNGSQLEPKGPNHYDGCRGASTQKDMVHMLIRGNDRVARWDDKDSTPSQISETTRPLVLGHIGDEWDEEYDRGKRKKVRMSQNEFDGKNPFQDIANERLKSQTGKQNLSKRPVGKNKQFKKSRFGNAPYRI
ncbi:ubiquitin specific protease domain protein [Artemisia annua]|uniref:Ubiquitin specific protease domain protein n=1 Tax=Artemisia annua TaxID=35608 RepID=A0A2U1LWW8_ARTAN|nr:ubiquitin specific protease domain protein [Artemisia annua]